MVVNITSVGALTRSLPGVKEPLEGDSFTVQEVLNALIEKHGQSLADELLNQGRLKEGLSLLINGRNVLSLPKRFRTSLEDGDEVIIVAILAGG